MKNSLWCGCVTAAVMTGKMSAGETTNKISAAAVIERSDIIAPHPYVSWIRRLPKEVENSATIAALDRFGPQAQFNWIHVFSQDGYGAIEQMNSAGKGLFIDGAVNGGRETFAEWLDTRNPGSVSMHLLEGSLGYTAEQGVKPLSPTPTASEISWWQRMKTDRNVSCGFRPFDGNPYAYLSTRWGHRGNGENDPIVLTLVRGYYDPIKLVSGVSGQLSFPISHDSQISFGTSFNPARMSSGDPRPPLSIHMVKLFGNNNPNILEKSLFVGAVMNNRGTSIDMGFSWPWR